MGSTEEMQRRSSLRGLQLRRLLLVAADAELRTRFVADVTPRGFLVDTAATAGEALELLGKTPYPLVVLGHVGHEDRADLIRALCDCSPEFLVVLLSDGGLSPLGEGREPPHNVVSELDCDWDVDELVETLHRCVRLHGARKSSPPGPPGADLKRLLLVEDLDSDAFLMDVQLRKHLPGCNLTRAATLAEALALLESERFDVIMSDLTLPDARGLDTVLRLQNAASETPMVVISGVEDDALSLQAVQAGAQDVISKDDLRGAALVRSLRYAEQRKRSEVRLVRMANFDALTGLANRAQFIERLGQAVNRARRRGEHFAVMYIDLDGFKSVNDTEGHDAGDAVLVEVSRRLEAAVRDTDLIARLGGDEFAVVLDSLPSPSEARLMAERLLASLARPYGQGAAATITASIGVAFYPEAGDSVAELLKAADRAMYEAKRRSRNTYELCVDAEAHRSDPELLLCAELKRALDRDEFCLHYQPQVDTEGALCSAEALLRWRRAGGRLLPPGEFLPMLEASSDIIDVGFWVLRTACVDLARWRENGLSLAHVAVNVSARQLEDTRFVQQVEGVLRETGLAPESLELEVTESTVMKRPERVFGVLSELGEMGVRLAMDDFGTGYSSLAHLHRMPFDTVKIDRSFVVDLTDSPKCRAVTRAIVALARELNLRTVAEGVETDAQLHALIRKGCDVFQGYLIGVPGAPELMAHALTVPANGVPRTISVTPEKPHRSMHGANGGNPRYTHRRRTG